MTIRLSLSPLSPTAPTALGHIDLVLQRSNRTAHIGPEPLQTFLHNLTQATHTLLQTPTPHKITFPLTHHPWHVTLTRSAEHHGALALSITPTQHTLPVTTHNEPIPISDMLRALQHAASSIQLPSLPTPPISPLLSPSPSPPPTPITLQTPLCPHAHIHITLSPIHTTPLPSLSPDALDPHHLLIPGTLSLHPTSPKNPTLPISTYPLRTLIALARHILSTQHNLPTHTAQHFLHTPRTWTLCSHLRPNTRPLRRSTPPKTRTLSFTPFALLTSIQKTLHNVLDALPSSWSTHLSPSLQTILSPLPSPPNHATIPASTQTDAQPIPPPQLPETQPIPGPRTPDHTFSMHDVRRLSLSPAWTSHTPLTHPPILSGTNTLLTLSDTTLHAITPDHASVLWSLSDLDPILLHPDLILSYQDPGSLHAFNPEHGHLLWTHHLHKHHTSIRSLTPTTHSPLQTLLFFSPSERSIFALHPRTGTPLWSTPWPHPDTLLLSTSQHTTVLLQNGHIIRALNTHDGAPLWTHDTHHTIHSTHQHSETIFTTHSTPNGHTLTVLHTQTGPTLTELSVPGPLVWVSPSTNQGWIFAFQTIDGLTIQHRPTPLSPPSWTRTIHDPHPQPSPPLLHPNAPHQLTLKIHSNRLLSLNTHNGATFWERSLQPNDRTPSTHNLPLYWSAGALLTISETLFILDPTTGSTLHNITNTPPEPTHLLIPPNTTTPHFIFTEREDPQHLTLQAFRLGHFLAVVPQPPQDHQ